MRIGSSGEEEGDEVGSREGTSPVESGVAVGIDNEVGIESIGGVGEEDCWVRWVVGSCWVRGGGVVEEAEEESSLTSGIGVVGWIRGFGGEASERDEGSGGWEDRGVRGNP